MWIRRLEVAHCAGIAAAGIDLDPGLNVLHGPNELGKSSLVGAIRAALLLQPSAASAESLRDWHSVEPPAVHLTFEQDVARIWRIRKTFGSGGHAYLDFSKDGADFSVEAKGREVDGRLQDILRWGIDAPGGRGGRRGMPTSLITTALLGQQSDVMAILRQDLKDDPNASGRERLTEALHALAEDPRFKQIVDAVQAKVDEAFTAKGRKRTGHGSPWVNLREQRENVATRERDVREQADKSAEVQKRVQNLSNQVFDARAEAEQLKDGLSRRRRRKAAELSLEDAEKALAGVESALERLADNERGVEAANRRIRQLEDECQNDDTAVADLATQVAEAQERVRGLEAGTDEQQRRLREEEAKNRRLKASQDKTEHERRVREARSLAGLAEQIQTDTEETRSLHAALSEKRDLLDKARQATAQDEQALEDLELQRHAARYLAARAAAQATKEERDLARRLTKEADELDGRASATRTEAGALEGPDDAQLERLRIADTEWRLARAKLSVGFVAEVTLATTRDAEAQIDGEPQTLVLQSGVPVELEADRELQLAIGNLAKIRIRGGGRNLLAEAQSAEERWQAASANVFARTGCSTIEELSALSRRTHRLLAEADDLGRQADDARGRAQDLDRLEQKLVSDETLVKHCSEAVAEYLEGGETVEGFVASLEEPPRDEGPITDDIAELQQHTRERQRLCDRMDNQVAADTRDLARRQADLTATETRFAAEAEKAGDWRGLVANAAPDSERLQSELDAVDAELAAIATEATTEVDTARQSMDTLVGRHNSTRETAEQRAAGLAKARMELAGLQGETGPLRANAEGRDLQGARAARDAARDGLAEFPPIDDSVDLATIESDADKAQQLLGDLESDLRRAEGALEQTGGQYLGEQRLQAEEAAKVLEDRERELELDYGAWRMLRETLGDAEKAGAAHLGNALVEPISSRMGALTGGRYGDISIGPHLDATGIELAGGERTFDALSVGTQEQVALLLRIAIAEALGTFVILDDQLTQSDPGRMTWMRDLLSETAERVQVVVLTCHPTDYQIGTLVDLTQRLKRSDPSSTPGSAEPDRDPPTKASVHRRRRQRAENQRMPDDLTAALKDSLDKRSN